MIVEKDGIVVDTAAATWVKSSFSSGNCDNCVEVASFRGAVAVRDSKNPDGAVLVFTTDEWTAFADGIKDGQLGA